MNYNSNLSTYGTFLFRLLLPSDIRVLLPTPKETYDLNLSKVTSSIWSFHVPTAICGTKNWYYLGSLPFPRLQHISQNMPEFAEMQRYIQIQVCRDSLEGIQE